MGSIWKTVLAFLVVVVIAASGIAVTIGNVDVVAANNYFEELSAVITESNYNEAIIEECIAEARENGYELTVSVCGDEKGRQKYAKAQFEYKYEIPFLHTSSVKVKQKIL